MFVSRTEGGSRPIIMPVSVANRTTNLSLAAEIGLQKLAMTS